MFQTIRIRQHTRVKVYFKTLSNYVYGLKVSDLELPKAVGLTAFRIRNLTHSKHIQPILANALDYFMQMMYFSGYKNKLMRISESINCRKVTYCYNDK